LFFGGVALYWTEKQAFERRNEAGTEKFKSFLSAIIVGGSQALILWLGRGAVFVDVCLIVFSMVAFNT
jgi:hypothetical protein